jgi:PAS domain S-box-containing protein
MENSTKKREQAARKKGAAPRLVADLKKLKTRRKRAEAAMQQACGALEQRIEESTAELLLANKLLKQEIEERKKAEAELKRTKEYLENVIGNSVDAIGIVDKHGRFILWNRRAAEIYGYQFAELTGKTAFELYPDRDALETMLAKLRQEGVVREYEIGMRKKDGSIVPMDISISLLKDDQGLTIGSVCVARDLSLRKKTEMELKRAQEELSRYSKDLERQVKRRTREITGILKYTPAMVYIKDKDCCYKLVNSRFEALFNIKNEEIQGKSDYDIFPLRVADQLRASDLQVLMKQQPRQVEEPIPLKDGIHTYLTVKFPIYDDEGLINGLCGISTDITEIKKAQEQLRRLSGSIMASQEKERTAIARELHDELGQVLTALRMDSVWLAAHIRSGDSRAADRAAKMCELIDATIDEVRGLATRLRPGVLDHLGLIDALEWYAAEFEKRTGISCTFQSFNISRVDDIVATAAYRIAQEALTNVARHSYATRVRITLKAEAGTLTLAVIDNGQGFNVGKIAAMECLGLAGMRERAGLIGGALEIKSRPHKGTQVYCRLPWEGTKVRGQ